MPKDTPDTLYVAPDAVQQAKIVIATTALQQQAEFLDLIDRAMTGWWDELEMRNAKKSIQTALEQMR